LELKLNKMRNKIIITFLCGFTLFLCSTSAPAQSTIPFTFKTRKVTRQEASAWKLANQCDKERPKMNFIQTEACYKKACDRGETKGCSRYALRKR
jgi:hypothetical protein